MNNENDEKVQSSNDNDKLLKKLQDLKFDNTQLKNLPIDENKDQKTSRLVPNACFSKVLPTPVLNPTLVSISPLALKECLDLDVNECLNKDNKEYFIKIFSGNELLPNSIPYSHCYCGYQFGNFAGQLGDGRAISLGEIVNSKNQRWELQLKGSGRTPYSRFADGRAVLRSSIREFLVSEAMHYLNIPTTRAGVLVTSDTLVTRDIFYNGNVIKENASIVLRLSPSFIRFGSFEISNDTNPYTGNSGPSNRDKNIIKNLADYVIKYHYPHLLDDNNNNNNNIYEKWYAEIVNRTIDLVVEWQCVGFVHGVLNTDNMSILGLTIDYGPYGFMEYYNPSYTPNHSDDSSRYCYHKQVDICKWNLNKLGEALDHANILSIDIINSKYLDQYYHTYNKKYMNKLHSKLGLLTHLDNDDELILLFLKTLENTGADFTNSFRNLNILSILDNNNNQFNDENNKYIDYILTQCPSYERYKKFNKSSDSIHELNQMSLMLKTHPNLKDILGMSLEDVKKELDRIYNSKNNLSNLTENNKKQHDKKLWFEFIEKYHHRINLEYNNNNNLTLHDLNTKRRMIMDSINPKYILRNYIMQNAINNAENGDYTSIENLLNIIYKPYEHDSIADANKYDLPLPDSVCDNPVSCSS